MNFQPPKQLDHHRAMWKPPSKSWSVNWYRIRTCYRVHGFVFLPFLNYSARLSPRDSTTTTTNCNEEFRTTVANLPFHPEAAEVLVVVAVTFHWPQSHRRQPYWPSAVLMTITARRWANQFQLSTEMATYPISSRSPRYKFVLYIYLYIYISISQICTLYYFDIRTTLHK